MILKGIGFFAALCSGITLLVGFVKIMLATGVPVTSADILLISAFFSLVSTILITFGVLNKNE